MELHILFGTLGIAVALVLFLSPVQTKQPPPSKQIAPTDYCVVEDHNGHVAFEKMVREKLKEGWKPLGGLIISRTSNARHYIIYYQAMVKN